MTSFSVIGSKYLVCPECRGAWVSHPTLLELVRYMRIDARLEMWTVEDKRDQRDNMNKTAIRFSASQAGVPIGQYLLDQPIIKLGKLSSCHVQLSHDSVSRMHAVIEFTRAAIEVIDLGSSAGTYVNGQKINKSALDDGDVLRLGEIDLRIALIPRETPPRQDAKRRCPTCNGRLSSQHVEDINVDVCDSHGVWFDAEELQSVLHRIGSPAQDT